MSMGLCFCPVPTDSGVPQSITQKTRQESAGRQNPSGASQKARRGSLTVECALALPVFLLACIILISVMNAVRLQTETDLKTADKARTLAIAAAAAEGAPPASLDSSAWIDLCAPHRMNLPSLFPGLPPLVCYSSARAAKWTGGGIDMTQAEKENADPVVYISDNRAVYHTHADCTYLNLSIYASTTEDIKKLRNANGGKYYPCRGFPKHYRGPVYATSNGTYYYPSLNYKALKRHVHTARLSECHDLSECTRCRGRN